MPARRLPPAVFAALLLSACSAPAPLIDAAPSIPSVPSLPVPGDFDPEGEFTVFDPCTEIPAEIMEQVGLTDPISDPSYDGELSVRCMFVGPDPTLSHYFTLTGDRVSREKIAEVGYLLSPTADSVLPGVYLHHMGSGVPDECAAALHTDRGRFVVLYTEILSTRGRDALCRTAVDTLETIYHQLGEHRGHDS